MKNISIIVAIAKNNAIGKNNRLLWHIPDDLKRVKRLTTGNVIIMGKNTYLSLPKKPLPDRTNIVISDDKSDVFEGCVMAYSIDEAIKKMSDTKENFIFGGASIYEQFLPYANTLYLTYVDKEFDADTFFPDINYEEWIETERKDITNNDHTNFNYSYIVLKRNKQY